MNYDRFKGKGWSRPISSRDGKYTEWYYIIDVKIVDVHETVKDEDGRAVFVKVPHKKGKGFRTVMKQEIVKRPAILAIKEKFSGSSARYSITNPTSQYAVSDKFLESLKREEMIDKLAISCIRYLFENGFEKWKKRYSGYKNLGL